MKTPAVALLIVATTLLAACGGSQYIMSTTDGKLLVSQGRPSLDDQAGTYTYRDAEGKTTTINKSEIVQIMER